MSTYKGFDPLPPALTQWLQEFPEKGYIALGTDQALVDLAIQHQLITPNPPYRLTAKGQRLRN